MRYYKNNKKICKKLLTKNKNYVTINLEKKKRGVYMKYYGIYDIFKNDLVDVDLNEENLIISYADYWFYIAQDDLMKDYKSIKDETELSIKSFDDYMNLYFKEFWSPGNDEEKLIGSREFLEEHNFEVKEIDQKEYDMFLHEKKNKIIARIDELCY